MGLKCSVLGHAYGETTVERDREERGSEVVITIRELETCDRCGDTRIVTENKEVTTIETPDEEPAVTPEDAVAALDGNDSAATGTGQSTESDDAGDALVDDAEGGAAVTEGSPSSPSPDAVEDQGAEILDDSGEPAADTTVDDELADPTIENEADVPGESADGEDAVILDDTTEESAAPSDEGAAGDDAGAPTPAGDASSAGEENTGHTPYESPDEPEQEENPLGEWPEETLRDTDEDDWTPTEDLDGTVGDVDPDASVNRELSTNSAVTVPEGEFHCQECGYTTDVESSSLRAGDYCPECRTGTLVHQPEE